MSPLAAQQQALLAVLFDWPADNAMANIAVHLDTSWARGLKAYQANGHALAQRALQGAYPVLAQVLGEPSFGQLARAFWHASPPVGGDITQWGAPLPAWVAVSAQLASEPYLGDLAALEWALHQAASAPDAAVDAASLALLAEHDPAQLHLHLSPGCAVLHSAWPVVSIWQVHQQSEPDFSLLQRLLHDQTPEDALVWRAGLRPQLRQAWPGEVAFVQPLLAGHTLVEALLQATEVDVAAWLPMAVQSHLLLGVARADAPG